MGTVALSGDAGRQPFRDSVLALALCLELAGCANYRPKPMHEVGFLHRARTQSEGGLTVTVAVPSVEEGAALFGVPLGNSGIRPVWVRVENRTGRDYIFLSADLDPDYFSPQEAAWMHRSTSSGEANRAMMAHFRDLRMRLYIPKGASTEGFVHTNLDAGVEYLGVVLFHPGHTRQFEFVVDVPGIETDYQRVDFDALVPEGSQQAVDRGGLRRGLEAMPCCTLGPDAESPGSPLNIVVGPGDKTFHPFVRRGWDVTETLSGSSVWRTIGSSLFGSRCRTSPVSPLFYAGRRQDIALQKARGTVDERNHLRLWLTPLTYEGKDVWIGQISRDIGVHLSSKTFVTHKVDPQVGEARDYLAQDLLLSGSLAALGYVESVGTVSPEEPRYNYTLGPYFTDGLRVVLIVDERYVGGTRSAHPYRSLDRPVVSGRLPGPLRGGRNVCFCLLTARPLEGRGQKTADMISIIESAAVRMLGKGIGVAPPARSG